MFASPAVSCGEPRRLGRQMRAVVHLDLLILLILLGKKVGTFINPGRRQREHHPGLGEGAKSRSKSARLRTNGSKAAEEIERGRAREETLRRSIRGTSLRRGVAGGRANLRERVAVETKTNLRSEFYLQQYREQSAVRFDAATCWTRLRHFPNPRPNSRSNYRVPGLERVGGLELLASEEVASHRVPAALAKDVTLPRAGPYLRGRRRQKRHSEREAEVGIDGLRGRVAARRAARTSCFGARPRGGYGADPLAAIKVRSSQIHG
jgi:hypothetical protein